MTVNVARARRGARYAERAGAGRRHATNSLTTILVSLALSMRWGHRDGATASGVMHAPTVDDADDCHCQSARTGGDVRPEQ